MPVSSDKIKVLFDAVSSSYDIGNINEFKTKMQDPAKRKAFYDGIGKEYDLGESLDVFEGKLGFKKKDGGVSPAPIQESDPVSESPAESVLPSPSVGVDPIELQKQYERVGRGTSYLNNLIDKKRSADPVFAPLASDMMKSAASFNQQGKKVERTNLVYDFLEKNFDVNTNNNTRDAFISSQYAGTYYSESPDLKYEYDKSDLKNVLTPRQFSGLKSLSFGRQSDFLESSKKLSDPSVDQGEKDIIKLELDKLGIDIDKDAASAIAQQGLDKSVAESIYQKAKNDESVVSEALRNYDYENPYAARSFKNIIKGAVDRGYLVGEQADILTATSDASGIDVDRLAYLQGELKNSKASKAYEQFSQNPSLENFKKNPIGIMLELGLESMSALYTHGATRMAAGAASGATVGSVLPGLGTAAGASYGTIAGTGMASLNLEYSSSILEGLGALGVNTSDAEQLKNAFADEKIMSDLKRSAYAKGIPVAIFDMLSAGVAGKILSKPARGIAGKVLAGTAETGIQAGLGAGGEAAKQLVSEGKIYDPNSILMEALGELGPGSVEIAYGTMVESAKRNQKPSTADVVSVVSGMPKDKVNENLDTQVSAGVITKEQADVVRSEVARVETLTSKMPEDISTNAKTKIADLLQQKTDLQQKAKTLDDAFKADVEQNISQIDQQIIQIAQSDRNATVQSAIQQQEGRPEGGVQERPGVDGGQQEVGPSAGQQGQAPVEVADTGDSVRQGEGEVTQPTEQETALAGELGRELRTEYMPIVEKAAQALSASKVQFEVLDDAEFTARTGQSAEGAFISTDKEGKILLNRQKMEEADPGVIIWHEASHPVMNIMRNTNKPLYDRVSSGLKQLATKNQKLADALQFGGQYADAIRKNGGTEEDAIATAEDESVVEAIAQIAADDKLLSSLPVSLKQSMIDFVNYVAKALGIKARISDTDAATFKRVAGEVAAALKEGRDISSIVGKENVMRYENNIAAESGSIETGSTVYAGQASIGGRIKKVVRNGYRKSVNLPVRTLESLLKEYGSNVIIVNSDPTGLGTVTLPGGEVVDVDGGIGYMALEENIRDGVGFASSSPNRVTYFNNLAKRMRDQGKLKNGKVLVLVMVQKPDSILGNNYTPLYVSDALTKIPDSAITAENLSNMLAQPFETKSMFAMFYEPKPLPKNPTDEEVKDISESNDLAKERAIQKVEKIKQEILSVDPRKSRDKMTEVFNELSFFQAQKYFDMILGGYTNKTKKYVKPISRLLYEHANADQKNLMSILGEKDLVDKMIQNPDDWGYAVAAFVHDTSKQDQKLGGIKHNLFNDKFQGDERFILDEAYRVNDIMKDFNAEQVAKMIERGKSSAAFAEQQTSQGMYAAGRADLSGASTTKYESIKNLGDRYVQYSLGSRTSPEYKQRANVASDNLVRIFQRDNVPLTKEEAIEIVDDLRDWTDWYDGLASYVGGIFGEYADDVLSLLPLSSQANSSAGTVSLSINNAERIYAGETPAGVAEYYGYVSKFIGGMGIESDKMRNFFKAIQGDPNAIAVDMHVWSIIKGRNPEMKAVNPKNQREFEAAKQFVNAVAEAMGVEPRGVQAALWAANILRTGGKPDSYEQYFADQVANKGLTERINGWRDKGYQPFTPARKQRQQQTGVQLSLGNRQAIIDKAKADGTYLKAPNGQPTKLTEDQWTTVRTPEFKKWFGDWENDPQNASKVVDNNGEPMVVYHGAREAGFDRFADTEGRKQSDAPDGSSFFTTDREVARSYSGTNKEVQDFGLDELDSRGGIYSVFLNIRSDYSVDFGGANWDGFLYGKFEVYNEETGETEIFDSMSEAENYADENGIDYSDIREDPFVGQSTNDFVSEAMRARVDGAIMYSVIDNGSRGGGDVESDVYVVFNPNQIKSATANVGTFSTEDNRIQFSAYQRPESKREFKLVSFVLRKKAEGYTDAQIAFAINSALPNLTPQEVLSILNNPMQYMMNAFPGMTPMQYTNLYRRAQVANIYRPRGFTPQVSQAFAAMGVSQDVLDRYYFKAKTKRQALEETIKSIFVKGFDPSKGLPKWIMQSKEFARGARNRELAQAKKTLDLLAAAAKKIKFDDWGLFALAMNGYGTAINNTSLGLAPFAPNYGASLAGLTLTSQAPASNPVLSRLPLEIQPFVKRMRDQIDGLSRKLIVGGFVNPATAVAIEKNLGQYVTRAYRLFNEKNFQPPVEVRNAAIDYLANEEYQILLQEFYDANTPAQPASATTGVGPVMSNVGGAANVPYADLMEQATKAAERRVNDILARKDNPYFGSGSIESRDTGILKAKKFIPVTIRELMGEYTDPGVTFMMTITKQASLAASSQFLRDMREQGLGTLFFEKNDPNRPGDFNIQIAGPGSSSLEPLNGLYTSEEIYEALQDAEVTRNQAIRLWMQIVGLNRWGKTVGSIRTQFVNFLSNLGFAVMNGLIFTKDGRPFSRAMGEAGKYYAGEWSDKEILDITNKAISLGLVGQSIDANAIKQAFQKGDMFEMALDVALTDKGIFDKTSKKVRPVSFFNKLYRLGDDFWKVYGYVSERSQIARLRFGGEYETLTQEQQDSVDREASDRVKDTWPTYDRMWGAVRKLSQEVPILGDFTAFQAESLRVLINAGKIMNKDMKDPQMRVAGMRRAGGMLAYVGIRTAVTTAVPMMLNYGVSGVLGALLNDDDEEDRKWALKEVAPFFMRTGDILAHQNKDKPHMYTVVDMLSVDPLNITARSLNALTEGNENFDPGFKATLAQLVGGFIGPEMTFSGAVGLSMNYDMRTKQKIYSEEDSDIEATQKIVKYVYKTIEPSTLGLIGRVMNNENKAAEAAAFAGFRPYEIDLHKSFNISLAKTKESFNEISKEYMAIKFDDKKTDEEKEQARLRAGEKKAAVVAKYHRLYSTLIKLGADPEVMEDIVRNMSAIKMTGMDGKTKNAIIDGEIDPESFY